MLYESVEFVHVDVGEKLTREIAERQSFACRRIKTFDNIPAEPKRIFVQILPENSEKNFVIDARKKFPYVAFQNQTLLRIVLAYLAGKHTEAVQGFMRTFIVPARERIGDELPVKVRVEHAIDRVVQQSVPHASLMNIPRLRVGNLEGGITTMAVRMVYKVAIECKNMIHEVERELLNVRLVALAVQEFPPCYKQTFDGYYFFEHNLMEPSPLTPPPDGITCR